MTMDGFRAPKRTVGTHPNCGHRIVLITTPKADIWFYRMKDIPMVPLLMLLIANAGMVDCKAFGARSGLPIEAQIARISANELDPSAKPIKNSTSSNNQSYQIGRLIYQGNGYSYRSFDDRFPLTALSFVGHSRSICQYQIVIPDGYDSATGTFIKKGDITFYHADQPPETPPG